MSETTADPVDPGDKKTFTQDYTALLGEISATEKIVASAWSVPDGLTVMSEAFDDTSATIKIDFANAAIGVNYSCYNEITTDSGEARRRALVIPVRDSASFSANAAEYKATLDAIRAAIAKTATRGQLRRQIGDKTIEWMSVEELMKAETRFQQLYNDAKRAERVAQGGSFMTTIRTRFVDC